VNTPIRVGLLLHPAFELLDAFGPMEMYSILGVERVEIVTIAQQAGPVASAMASDGPLGPSVLAEYGFDDVPALDVLVIPGGFGTIAELENETMLEFLRQIVPKTGIVTTVCTGSVLLAKSGVLDGCRATTNKQFFSLGRMTRDAVEWVESARWVDAGKFVTSSGVSAGMDMTLAVISRLFDEQTAREAAAVAEYTWHEDADLDPFVQDLDKGLAALARG
jgi:putative intracellular protease/amidase